MIEMQAKLHVKLNELARATADCCMMLRELVAYMPLPEYGPRHRDERGMVGERGVRDADRERRHHASRSRSRDPWDRR